MTSVWAEEDPWATQSLRDPGLWGRDAGRREDDREMRGGSFQRQML